MLRTLASIAHGIRALPRPRFHLAVVNAASRQQLAVFKQKRPRPSLSNSDRVFWVTLSHFWSDWTNALIVVKPATVTRWHRQSFKCFWRWKSRKRGRARTDREIRVLIVRMATENGWRAPRIHAELLKLGLIVSERTVSRYLPKQPADPSAIEQWKTFLRNHRDVLAAMDFFSVPTAGFRVLYVLFIVHHERRQLLHLGVTAHPTADWIIRQLHEAFPFDTAPRYLIFDGDRKFRGRVEAAVRNMGIQPTRTAYRSPWQNGVAERLVGSIRRELLDHVVAANDKHLRRLLRDYQDYDSEDRCHLTLGKDPPVPRPVQPRPSPTAKVTALPRVGGIHHRYVWQEHVAKAA